MMSHWRLEMLVPDKHAVLLDSQVHSEYHLMNQVILLKFEYWAKRENISMFVCFINFKIIFDTYVIINKQMSR